MATERFESIGRHMMITDKYFKLYLRESLAPYELNTAQGIVLMMMYHNEAVEKNTQENLIRRIHYDKGVMTRTMKELEQKGYVLREPNPADSRSYLFSLTEKGLAFQETMMQLLHRWNEGLLCGIPKEELSVLKSALSKMAQNACAQCTRQQAN